MGCFGSSNEYPLRITDMNKALQMTTVMTERGSPEPARNPDIHRKLIAIWGIDSTEVIDLRDERDL